MLSRLNAHLSMQRQLARILQQHRNELQNAIFKRDSGHNTMMVKPSTFEMRFLRNWLHFYFVLIGVPLAVITTIINIRANPVLTEVPDGYEPRHWEYYKHPVTRTMAKYFFHPIELDHEVTMSFQEYKSERIILGMLSKNIEKVMKFYNDHRSREFAPQLGADYIRKGRELWSGSITVASSAPGHAYEEAFNKDVSVIPVEGYKDGPIDGM